jgi:hypothetical protein
MFAYELQRRLTAADAHTISVAAHPEAVRTDLQRHLAGPIKVIANAMMILRGQLMPGWARWRRCGRPPTRPRAAGGTTDLTGSRAGRGTRSALAPAPAPTTLTPSSAYGLNQSGSPGSSTNSPPTPPAIEP